MLAVMSPLSDTPATDLLARVKRVADSVPFEDANIEITVANWFDYMGTVVKCSVEKYSGPIKTLTPEVSAELIDWFSSPEVCEDAAYDYVLAVYNIEVSPVQLSVLYYASLPDDGEYSVGAADDD